MVKPDFLFVFLYSKSSYSMRAVRVALSNGKRVIGIRYPECLVELAEELVREQKVIDVMQAVRTKHKVQNKCHLK